MQADPQLAFRALGDPTRRSILLQLRQEELTIAEVVDRFDLTRTAVRKHLLILEEGDLISVSQRGKERVSRLNPEGLKSADNWFRYFDSFWDSKLTSLKQAVEKTSGSTQKRKKP